MAQRVFQGGAIAPNASSRPNPVQFSGGGGILSQGSAILPNYSTLPWHQFPAVQQSSAYENFSTYTVMGVQNQQAPKNQSPVIISLINDGPIVMME
jgi:hypothetical protein